MAGVYAAGPNLFQPAEIVKRTRESAEQCRVEDLARIGYPFLAERFLPWANPAAACA